MTPIAYEVSFDFRSERIAKIVFWLLNRFCICGFMRPIMKEDLETYIGE